MRIWIIGAGSIGLLYAAKLQLSGTDASLITRTDEQAKAITEQGVALAAQDGAFVARCPAMSVRQAEVCLTDAQAHAPDWILLTVKQYGLPQLSDFLRRAGAAWPAAKLLAMQNGIGHLDMLADWFPVSRLYGAVVSEGAERTGPSAAVHTGSGQTIIGPAASDQWSSENVQENLKLLQKVLENAGFRTVLSNRLKDEMWIKLIINSVINPLTALMEIRNGALFRHEALVTVMRQLVDEALAVASLCGVQLDVAVLWDKLREVCDRTAGNQSSTLQDMKTGRPTELPWITGSIVRLGERTGLAVPTHAMMMRLLEAKEDLR